MPRKFKVESELEITSPHNPESDIVKVGERDGAQRYQDDDGNKFRDPSKYGKGRHFTNQQVGVALQAYFDGLSYREISRLVGRSFDIDPPDPANIYRWVQDYSAGVSESIADLKANTGDRWVADEMEIRLGGHKFWIWNVMDSKTRYLLASMLSPRHTQGEAKRVLRMAKRAASTTPKVIKTDGLTGYVGAIPSVFGNKVKHVVSQGPMAEINNNLVERVQGTMREREKVLRSLKTPRSGQTFLDGWRFDYNYLRPHLGLGKRTPARAAGIDYPLATWVDVAGVIQPVRPKRGREVGFKARKPRKRKSPKGRRGGAKRGRPIAKGGRDIEGRQLELPDTRPKGEKPPKQRDLDEGKRR